MCRSARRWSAASPTARCRSRSRKTCRRQEVFVMQSTCAPTADNFMELLVLVDALKRASAASVTAVMPYFGYARQDRRPRSARVPITAKVAAKMIGAVGTDRVLTVDLHADQIQGFFDIPLDNVYASPVLLADIWRYHGNERPDRGLAGRRWRGARARDRQAPRRCRPGDHRQAPSAAERGDGDEHHRRGRRTRSACWSTTSSTPPARCARPARR